MARMEIKGLIRWTELKIGTSRELGTYVEDRLRTRLENKNTNYNQE